MADLGFTSKQEDVKDYKDGFEIIPPGWYPVVIIESEVKDNSAETGKLLELKLEVQNSSRSTLIDRLNVVHESEVAQRIGRAKLAKIAESIGHKAAVKDSSILHGRPFDVKVSIENFTSNTSGETLQSNKITGYRKFTKPAPVTPEANQQQKAW